MTYRIPKADDVFAPVEEPTMFNLLDRDSVNTQLPQISVKPSAAASASASLNTKQDGQQNNITIHTDSLVFTLLGDGQTSPQTPMIAPMQNTTPIAANPPTTPHYIAPPVTTENPMNWTIAVIAALIVLIMQLFYWVLLML